MPSTDVEVTPPCVVPATVLVRANLTQIRRHHIKGRVAHGQSKANVSDHWSDQIPVIALAGTSVPGGIGLAVESRGDGHNAFLPCGAEALAPKS